MNFSQLWTTIKSIASKVETTVQTVVADIDKAAPIVEGITQAVYPSAVPAEKAIVGILDAVEAAIAAAGAATSGGVTVSLPAELVAAYNGAKTSIEADLKALGVKV